MSHRICYSGGGDCDEGGSGGSDEGCGSVKILLSLSLLCVSVASSMICWSIWEDRIHTRGR
ncbi:transmembrane protein, putative [Medicago truncatula]|uniref:Transmembrane protein, putative n=1 Tax=Medicago truncatula TaxID=3880 RepID=G7JZ49_MEDTR|nr:transmembrane protein, putative [Medicago truncatula]